MTTWLDNDTLFEEQLAVGHRWQQHVIGLFRDYGIACEHSPLEIDPSRYRDNPERFSDEHDIVIGNHAVEVKSRDLVFTSPADFPYASAMFYTVRGWEAKETKPCAVVVVSQRTEGVVVVPRSTQQHWKVVRKYDRVRQCDVSSFEVDREHLRTFRQLVGWFWLQGVGG